MLLKKGRITEEMIRMLSAWKHSGFNVFCGNRISLSDDTAMENPARCIIRASFSQERMKRLYQERTVVYTAKDRSTNKVFPAMEWLAAMCSHIPNRGGQMARYYGYYSSVLTGKRRQKGSGDAIIPCILEPQGNMKAFRKSWARLIRKICEVEPPICPKWKGTTRIISFIEYPSVIRDILNHLGLWPAVARPPSKAHAQPVRECTDVDFQLQTHADTTCGDPDYSRDEYIQS